MSQQREKKMNKPKKLKNLKQGEHFTLRPIAEPKESQVYIRGEYDRCEKKYECIKFLNICHTRYFKGEKEVYTDFIFWSTGAAKAASASLSPPKPRFSQSAEPPHTIRKENYNEKE